MTTTAMHRKLERGRLTRHLKSTPASAAPCAWREARGASVRPVLSAADAAAVKVTTEAQRVREMVYACGKTDPGFVADLCAAASRHDALVR